MLKNIFLIALILTALIAGPACLEEQVVASISEVEDSIIQQVNEVREAEGLPALSRSTYLDSLAKEYANSRFSEEGWQSSDIRYLLSNSWQMDYNDATPQLDQGTAGVQVAYLLEQTDMKDTIYRPEARETGIGIAVTGDTVYYSQIFDVVNSSGGHGQPIRLSENPEAVNPSWEQLKAFLKQDDTDEVAYQLGAFICGDFAETLHNNAERAGIKTAYVSIGFNQDPGHALNAFSVEGQIVFIDVISGDKVAYIEAGKSYGVIALDVVTDFSYSYFESYARRVEKYLQDHEAYSQELKDYNQAVKDYNNGKPVPVKYSSRQDWYQILVAWDTALDNRYEGLMVEAEALGMTDKYWNPTGSLVGVVDPTVVRVHVHW